MTYPLDKRQAVKASYVLDRLSLRAAAELHDVSHSTVRQWKKQDETNGLYWKKERYATNMSERSTENILNELLNDLLIQYQSTMKLLKTDEKIGPDKQVQLLSSLADAMTKTVASFKKFSPVINELSIALDVIKLLINFIKEEKPEYKNIIVELLEPFGKKLLTHYG